MHREVCGHRLLPLLLALAAPAAAAQHPPAAPASGIYTCTDDTVGSASALAGAGGPCLPPTGMLP